MAAILGGLVNGYLIKLVRHYDWILYTPEELLLRSTVSGLLVYYYHLESGILPKTKLKSNS